MTPERWQSVAESMEKALRLQESDRSAYLDQLAVKDPELRDEVESLLASHARAGAKFLEAPAAHTSSAPDVSSPSDEMLGRRLGAYQIVARIGVGGMGEVYRAFRADDLYCKQVAVKVLRAGQDSGFVISRFKTERQILALLDHPNIARLLDGGTTEDGAPYFVMELIEGESIDRYCEHHHLVTNARLKLFLQVCSAVQFAHQRLIIHRDLKPGNILVTTGGTPKLLDFGIAKLLDPDVATSQFQPTLTMFRILTPGYASPEQIKGEPITTESDVYSLGVVLYELLTGQSPYHVSSRSQRELAHAVCEIEPEKPSAALRRMANGFAEHGDQRISVPEGSLHSGSQEKLAKQLVGDLDNIVLMALRKEPRRRYASIWQFAEDIRRHLENLPVIARKDTVRYRTSKFVARHKTGVLAAMSVITILIVALIVTLREAHIARQQAELAHLQRVRAERRFNDVRKLANSLMFEIHDSIADLPGATKARGLLVKRALEYLDNLARESADPALQREIAAAYQRMGDVQGYIGMANLNDYSGASLSYAKAMAILEPLTAATPNDLDLRAELLRSYFEASAAFENTGDFDSDLRILGKARTLISTQPGGISDGQQQFNMSGIYYYTGRALEKSGNFSSALENYQRAMSIMEPVATSTHASSISRSYLAGQYIAVGKMLARLGRTGEAVTIVAKGLNVQLKLSKDDPTNATLVEGLADDYTICAEVLAANGDAEGGLRLERLTKEIYRELTTKDPNNGMAKVDLAWTDLNTAEILLRQGKVTQAAPLIRAALPTFEKVNPANEYWYAVQMAQTYLDLGMVSAALAERAASPFDRKRFWGEASFWYQKALDVRTTGPGQLDSDGRDQIGEIHRQLARAASALGQMKSDRSQRNE
jgi:non-specific serine/threonine protein kinase/serine/threonine-protein kinase